MKKLKVFSIGGATLDIFIKTDDHGIFAFKTAMESKEWIALEHGAKINIDEIHETFGGGATNTSTHFSQMGFDAYFVGMIGSLYGDKVLNNLHKFSVNTDFAVKTKKEKTGFSVIINSFDGDRTILAYPGANKLFSSKDLPIKELKTADFIFLNHISESNSKIFDSIIDILDENPKIKLAWNPGSEQINKGLKYWAKLLKHTDMLFLNKDEAVSFSGINYIPAGIKSKNPKHHEHSYSSFLPIYADDVCDIMKEFLKYKVKNVIITDGKNGSQLSDGKKIYFCPVIMHELVDSTGAGDAFASAFSSSILMGKDLEYAMKFATLNSHNVINFYGAQDGLFKFDKINKMLKDLDILIRSIKIN